MEDCDVSTASYEKPAKQSTLNAEASKFEPGASTHICRARFKGLRPEALPFSPRSGLNPLAKPFSPNSPVTPSKHPNHPARALSYNLLTKTTLSVHAEVFVPGLERINDKHNKFTNSSPNQDVVTVKALSVSGLPHSITRSWVESGQFIRRPQPKYLLPLPSSFPIEDGSIPGFVQAFESCYDGSAESQRQKFKICQNDDREIYVNWKGRLLCANGEEFPQNLEHLTAEQEDAEIAASPASIHHFNWQGNAVHFKSTTPPAVSLVVIMSLINAKGLSFDLFDENLFKSTIFKNALTTIDPVYYYGKDITALHHLHGTKLQELVTGDVAKIYSENGSWSGSEFGSDDENDDTPHIDPLDHTKYRHEHVIMNGWYRNYQVPTVREFAQLDSNANEERSLQKKLSLLRKLRMGNQLSKLNQVTLLNELDRGNVCKTSSIILSNSHHHESTSKDTIPQRSQNAGNELSTKVVNWADKSEDLTKLPLLDQNLQQTWIVSQIEGHRLHTHSEFATNDRHVSSSSSATMSTTSSIVPYFSCSSVTTMSNIEDAVVLKDSHTIPLPTDVKLLPKDDTGFLTDLVNQDVTSADEDDSTEYRQFSPFSVTKLLDALDLDGVSKRSTSNQLYSLQTSKSAENLIALGGTHTRPTSMTPYSGASSFISLDKSAVAPPSIYQYRRSTDTDIVSYSHNRGLARFHGARDLRMLAMENIPDHSQSVTVTIPLEVRSSSECIYCEDIHSVSEDFEYKPSHARHGPVASAPICSAVYKVDELELSLPRPAAPTPSKQRRFSESPNSVLSSASSNATQATVIKRHATHLQGAEGSDYISPPDSIDNGTEVTSSMRDRITFIEPPRSAFDRNVSSQIVNLDSAELAFQNDTEAISVNDESATQHLHEPAFSSISMKKHKTSFGSQISRKFGFTYGDKTDERGRRYARTSLLNKIKTKILEIANKKINVLH